MKRDDHKEALTEDTNPVMEAELQRPECGLRC